MMYRVEYLLAASLIGYFLIDLYGRNHTLSIAKQIQNGEDQTVSTILQRA